MRLSLSQQRQLMKTLPIRHKKFIHQYCKGCQMRGDGIMDIVKSVGKFGKKTIKSLTPAAKSIIKELKPIVKEVGPVILKEVIAPMLKAKFAGGGMKMYTAGSGYSGSGLSPAGSGLRLAGQRGKGCCGSGKKRNVSSNPWLVHVKKVRASHMDKKYSDVLKLAAKSYTKK
tara:strand:- start:681 stop:1193 length:513 start_codon:yes stop_codon:yes gene_type:complete